MMGGAMGGYNKVDMSCGWSMVDQVVEMGVAFSRELFRFGRGVVLC